MKRFFEYTLFPALIGAAVALLTGIALGQCPSCNQSAAFAPAGYRWRQLDRDNWCLWLGSVQVGAWRQSDGAYRPLCGDKWGGVCSPPIAPPVSVVKPAKKKACDCCSECGCGNDCPCHLGRPCSDGCRCLLSEKAGEKNYGIVTDRVGGHGERYMLGGQSVSRKKAIEAVVGGPSSIPDDRDKLSLTFAGGTDAERQSAVNAAKKSGLSETCIVQDYDGDSPLLDPGFVVPSTYLQLPNGKVLARVPCVVSYVELAAVRKAVPDYDPAKDPDPTKPALGLTLEDLEKKLGEVPAWVWFAGAVALYLFCQKKQQPPVQPA